MTGGPYASRRAVLAAGASGVLASIAGCSDRMEEAFETFDGEVSVDPELAADEDSWSVVHGDAANTRSVPADAVPESSPSIEWTESFETVMGYVHPVARDGVVIASDWDDDLFAIDVETGDRLWTATYRGRELRTAPVIADDDGVALIGTRSSLLAVDLADGEPVWRAGDDLSLGTGRTDPTAADDLALVGTTHGVAAHDLESGERRWERRLGLEPTAVPAIVDETVYVGGGDATLHALERESGEVRWRTNADGPISAGPAVTDDRIYVGTDAGTLLAYDRDGDRRWRTDLGDASVSTLAVGNGVVCAGTGDDELTVVDPDSGDRVWRSSRYVSWYANGPVVGGGLVFATVGERAPGSRNRTVGAFDAESGDLEWEFEGSGLESGPAVVDGALYLTGRWENERVVAKLS